MPQKSEKQIIEQIKNGQINDEILTTGESDLTIWCLINMKQTNHCNTNEMYKKVQEIIDPLFEYDDNRSHENIKDAWEKLGGKNVMSLEDFTKRIEQEWAAIDNSLEYMLGDDDPFKTSKSFSLSQLIKDIVKMILAYVKKHLVSSKKHDPDEVIFDITSQEDQPNWSNSVTKSKSVYSGIDL